MTGSNRAGQNELSGSKRMTQRMKINWEWQTFCRLTHALMGDPFTGFEARLIERGAEGAKEGRVRTLAELEGLV
jgi:hypothetical protein